MKKFLALLAAFTLLLSCAAAETVIGGSDGPTSILITEDGNLPAYVYTGDDSILAAVLAYTTQLHECGYQEEINVTIPAPVIVKTEQPDDTHARVYGDFWGSNYTLEGDILKDVSGGEAPGILELELKDGIWQVVNFIQAEDGEDFYTSIEAMCGGDEELFSKMTEATDGGSGLLEAARKQYVGEYVRYYGLPIAAYQEYGWDPVPLD